MENKERKLVDNVEALENEMALTRLKNKSLRCACCRYTVRSPNALRAAV